MYIPKQFDESNLEVLHQLVRAHPLGALVTLTPNGLDANHIPFLVKPAEGPYGTLHGHVARANPVWRDYSRDVQALVVFQGPEAFVSPSWYPSKRETGKVVPTWNYVVVHAHGHLRIFDNRDRVRAHLEELTNRHEAGRFAPWKVTDAPADYIEQMLGSVVGIEIPIARLVGKWKVSQNRSARDCEGVAEGLMREGDRAAVMAGLVRQRCKSRNP